MATKYQITQRTEALISAMRELQKARRNALDALEFCYPNDDSFMEKFDKLYVPACDYFDHFVLCSIREAEDENENYI